jgi:hypothetical protein
MNLSALAVLLGLGVGLPQVYGLLKPKQCGEAARRFPRSELWGYGLMLTATAWFLWNLHQENISDFAAYKPAMMIGFGAVGIGACFFLRDFLAVRGLAVLMLLLAKLIVDTARWADSEWRLVLVTWAYAMVVAGMWWTVSPWRVRDLIGWTTATEGRIRLLSGVRLAFGLLLLILGLTAFRT